MKYNAAQTACEAFGYGEVEDYTVTFGAVVADTQAPTVPTGLAASNVTQSSATISWTASTDNVGVTGYEVYKNGALLGTSTTTSYSATGLSAATSYSFTVKAKDLAGNSSALSSALSVTTLATQLTYCTSKGGNVTYEWIDYVALGSMTNTTTANGGYGDFTGKVATVNSGASVTISYSAGFQSSAYTEFWYVWIDWNQNGTFDSNELMSSNSSNSSATLTATFTVPATALLGNTRMRVTMKYNAAPTACETFSYGEVEDYTITVVAGQSLAPTSVADQKMPNNVSVNLFPNPATSVTTVAIIAMNPESFEIKVVDAQGRVVINETNLFVDSYFERQMDLSRLNKGIYFVQVIGTDIKETRKLIIQ